MSAQLLVCKMLQKSTFLVLTLASSDQPIKWAENTDVDLGQLAVCGVTNQHLIGQINSFFSICLTFHSEILHADFFDPTNRWSKYNWIKVLHKYCIKYWKLHSQERRHEMKRTDILMTDNKNSTNNDS